MESLKVSKPKAYYIPTEVTNEVIRRAGRILPEIFEELYTGREIVHYSDHRFTHKAICPFHPDRKNPNLRISTEGGNFYCNACQRKGNVATLWAETHGLNIREDYRRVIEGLAERVGIEIEVGSDAKQNLERKKHFIEINRAIEKFCRDAIEADEEAKRYLEGRGFDGFDFETWKFGVTGRYGDLKEYLYGKGFEKKDIEIALRPKKLFQERRVLIPWRNAKFQPIGFVGRAFIEGDSPKYINSDSILPTFQKGKAFFGIEYLLKSKEFEKTGVAYVLEGYLDLARARKMGLTNAVALGATAMTTDHARLLQTRYGAQGVVIWLDGDEEGRKSTMTAIQRFLDVGLSVELKVISLEDGKDPDEWFGCERSIKNVKEELEHISYIEWYLNYLGSNEVPIEKKFEAFKPFALGHDSTTRGILYKSYVEQIGGDAQDIRFRVEGRPKTESTIEDNPVYEMNGCYCETVVKRLGRGQTEETQRAITSFVLTPRDWIVTDDGEVFRAVVIMKGGERREIDIPKDAFDSRQKLLKAMRFGESQFVGTDKHCQYILALLAGQEVRKRRGVKAIGWHEGTWLMVDGTAIGSEGMIDDPETTFYDPLETLLVKPRYGKREDVKEILEAFQKDVWKLHAPDTIALLLGWTVASFAKPVFLRETDMRAFPIASVFGSSGGGKTTLIREVFLRLCGVDMPLFDARQSTFIFQIVTTMMSSIPACFDEFITGKLDKDDKRAFIRACTNVYEMARTCRGRADLTSVSYTPIAPVCVIGESSLGESDPALGQRVVAINCNPAMIESQSPRQAYARVSRLRLEAIPAALIPFMLQSDVKGAFETAREKVHRITGDIAPRIVNNLSVVGAGLILWWKFLKSEGLGVESVPDEPLEDAVRGHMENMELTSRLKPESYLDRFVEAIGIMANSGELERGKHYIVRPGQLHIAFNECFARYLKWTREVGWQDVPTDRGAYRREMRENTTYVDDTRCLMRGFLHNTYKRTVVLNLDAMGQHLDIDTDVFIRNITDRLGGVMKK